MKLWEVFKELEIPSDRLFRSTYNGWTFEVKNKDGWFEFNVTDVHGDKRNHLIPSGAFNDNAKADLDWQEVKQPVTWQEAIQAWHNKKNIYVESGEHTFWHKASAGADELTIGWGEIQWGTWYVED